METASKRKVNHLRYSSVQESHYTFKELVITTKFLKDITGKTNLALVTVLNLQFKDHRFPKIKHLSGLHVMPKLRSLDLSYNEIESIKGCLLLFNLVNLNLSENKIKSLDGLVLLYIKL